MEAAVKRVELKVNIVSEEGGFQRKLVGFSCKC